MIQPKSELSQWHKVADPWGYEQNRDDATRKLILLSELPDRHYTRVLDIGCGQGFVTRDLPGDSVLGVDVSEEAIRFASRFETERIKFLSRDLFHLNDLFESPPFDLIIITGVLYRQYIGESNTLVYLLVDKLLAENGILVSAHIDQWYVARFPYAIVKESCYRYREFQHRLEIYSK